ncbi:MAG: polysaccharide biosynthesis tyrosine autokinase [Phycisphaerales bacterium]
MQPRPGAPVATQAAVSAAVLDPIRLLRMYWHWLAVAFVIGAAIGFAVYTVLGRVAPLYRSTATFQVQPPYDAENPALQGEAGNRDEIDRFMRTEIQKFQSPQILIPVVEDPAFQQLSYARQFMAGGAIDIIEARVALSEAVSASLVPDTNYFRFSVSAPTATDAAEIARLITESYMTRTNAGQRTNILSEQGNLRDQMDTIREEMNILDREINTLLSDKKLTSLRETDTEFAIEVRQLQTMLGAMRQQRSLLTDQLASYQEQFESSQGRVYPPAVIMEAESDPIARGLESEIVSLKADLDSARERLGPNHQTVIFLESRIRSREQSRKQILDERQAAIYQSTVEGLSNQLSALNASENDTVERLAAATAKLQDITQVIKEVEGLTRERTQLGERLNTLQIQNDSVQLLQARGIRVRLEIAPRLPEGRAFPQLRIFLPLGVILACGIAGGLVVLKEIREKRIRTPQDVSLIPRTRLLGVLPDIALDPKAPDSFDKACLMRPDGSIAETMRQVRTTLLKKLETAGHRSLLIAPAAPGSGASSVAANLAVSLARVDKRVLLIDANLRKPSLHTTFTVAEGPGVAEILRDPSRTLAESVIQTSEPNLSILTAGTDRRGVFDRLNTDDMNRIIREAEAAYDLVIIDAPPAVVSTDAMAIAQHAASTLLVVRAYAETRGLLARLRNQFADVPAEFLGVILNAVPTAAGGYMKRNIQQTIEYSKSVMGDHGKKSGAATA